MKKTILLAFILFVTEFNATAIHYSGSFTFANQAEVDAFPTNYPNCHSIAGSIRIGYNSVGSPVNNCNIYDLTPLTLIQNIGGDLDIRGCNLITDSSFGLMSSLLNLGGRFYIRYCNNLHNLNSFSSLWYIGGDLDIRFCNTLSNIDGLSNVVSFVSISPLSSINSIIIDNCPQLTNISGLGGVFSIDGSLSLTNNGLLANVNGLSNLNSINGGLSITHCYSLSSLAALNIGAINGQLSLVSLTSLTSLNGLENISPTGITSIGIMQNTSLSYCAVASICARIGIATSNITISSNSVGCNNISQVQTACANLPTGINLIMYLQGYYSANGAMIPALMNQGVISNTDITDSIMVELHNSTSPYATVRTSNTILNTNGTASCSFSPTITGSFYIVVKHRNGITTWSALPVNVGVYPIFYDFTTDSSKAYGNNMLEVESGKWAFYSGDLNNDQNSDLLDLSSLESDTNSFQFGYKDTDLNGDGNVDLLDSSVLEPNVNNFIYSIHP